MVDHRTGSRGHRIKVCARLMLLGLLLHGTAFAQPAQRAYRICDDRGCRVQDNQAVVLQDPSDTRLAQRNDIDLWRGEPVSALEAEAQGGDLRAHYRLGLVYLFGLAGERVDALRASAHLLRAAAGHHAWAQFRLAELYRHGQGVGRDPRRATEWMFRAAQLGVPAAAYNVGVMYASGQGAPKDAAEAERWYLMAAEGGVTEARYALAVIYLQGSGPAGPQLYEGFQMLKAAAQGGHTAAQAMLGQIYLTGLDTLNRDQREARLWLERAAAQGDRSSRQRLTELNLLEKEQRQHRHEMALAQQETMKFVMGAAVHALLSPPPVIALLR